MHSSAAMVLLPGAAATSLLLLLLLSSAAAQQELPAAGCPTSCGDVSVPYPFGIGAGCFHSPGFNLTCDTTRGGRPRLLVGRGTMYVVDIFLANSTMRVMDTNAAVNITMQKRHQHDGNGTWRGLDDDGPFVASETANQFVVTGCNVQAALMGDSGGANIITACSSICSINDKRSSYVVISPNATDPCTGIGCCETPIPIGRPSYCVDFTWLDKRSELRLQDKLPVAMRVAERGWFNANFEFLLNVSKLSSSLGMEVPVVLDWALNSVLVERERPSSGCPDKNACRSSLSTCHNVTGNYRTGYVCRCNKGYQGNPYLTGGCQDIDECAMPGTCPGGECTNTDGAHLCRCPLGASGNPQIANGCVKSSLGLSVSIGLGSAAALLLLVLAFTLITRKLKQRRAKMQRQQFFKHNRGHLLEQLVSQKADIAERMIIPLEELEEATNNFDKAREIGGGGHGTVYKGILSDLHVVAIKKSKIADQREIDEFINEVAILSQINHRNVVKLFGCCLETEVPLLVYEFISNGTLYHHLHVLEHMTSLSWDDRLRIATETAKALAYLHSAVSFPIIHRDIKSQNILLDDTLVAKVSDFGASRSMPVDKETIQTAVQGTIGYMDPMYYCTGRLTEKSDVYSFGVLLIELLTRKKPNSYRSSEDDSLLVHFTHLLGEGKVVLVLDPQVVKEGGKEVEEVAMLAAACVRMVADDRPTMRQVEMVLESLCAPVHEMSLMLPKIDVASYNNMVQMLSSENEEETTSGQYSLEGQYLLNSRYPR